MIVYYLQIANDLVNKWEKMAKGEHIPITEFMMAFALKCSLAALYGEKMKSDKKVLEFHAKYSVV